MKRRSLVATAVAVGTWPSLTFGQSKPLPVVGYLTLHAFTDDAALAIAPTIHGRADEVIE
jgi:hypothetical protein